MTLDILFSQQCSLGLPAIESVQMLKDPHEAFAFKTAAIPQYSYKEKILIRSNIKKIR